MPTTISLEFGLFSEIERMVEVPMVADVVTLSDRQWKLVSQLMVRLEAVWATLFLELRQSWQCK